MTRFILKLTLMAIAMMAVGCRSSKPIVLERLQVDSIVVVEKIRDTTVSIESDSSMIKALVRCDSLGEAYISEIVELRGGSRLAAPSIKIDSNVLTSTAAIDSMQIYLQLKERHTSHTIIAKEEVTAEVDAVALLTPWQRAIMTLGYVALAITAIATARFAAKIFT